MGILCAIDTPKLQELYDKIKDEIPNYKDFMTYVTVWQSRQFMGNPYYNGTDYPTKRDILRLKKETETSSTDNIENKNTGQNNIKNVEASVLFSSIQRADRVNTILKVFYAITDQLYDIYKKEGGNDSYRDYIVNNLNLITNTVKEFFNPENQPSKKRLFKQVYDNFTYLFDNTVPIINYIEGLSIYREEESEEAEVKDSWMQKTRTTDFHSTLSNKIRKMLLSIDKYDRKGNLEYDDMGVARVMSPAYIIPVLLENLNPSLNAEDFFNKLVGLQSRYPWIKGILDKFNLDESLKSQFYHFFNKEFMPYWISFSDKVNPNRYVLKPLNQKSSSYFLIKKWATAYNFTQILSKDSVYSEGGKLNKTKAASNLVKLSALIDSVKDKFNIQNEKQVNKLKELLLTVGIVVDNADLKDILNTSTEWSDSNFSYITSALYTIFNKIKNEDLSNYKNGILQVNITQEFKSAYKTIANILSLKSEDTYLRNFKELDATYQSYAAPSYKGILLANLKNLNDKEFLSFINNEFLYDQIFYTKEFGIRNIWLKELAENKSARSILDWRIILHSNRKGFNDWSDPEYMKIIINQFLSDWNNKEKTAWYYIPLLADAESAEFIRFYRYSEEKIIKNMTLVLRQEYDRIMRVRAREAASVNPITNYDIIYDDKTGERLGAIKDKDGNITYSSTGDTFKYFPELNGTGFLETLENKFLNKDPLISEFLYNTMKNLMNIRFFDFVKRLDSLGLYEDINREAEKQNSSNFYTPDGDPIPLTSLPSILRHFFYNSEFAQTQIMQIFISDPAFFKNPTDFQKRFKGIYSQALRLNTTSKYGKKNERYIILSDLYVPFGNMEFIKKALNNRVKSGYLTETEKKTILDSLSDVSPVTDAQAYRTPESYRAVMDMAGRWSEENEELYDRIKEGTWTYSDFINLFNIIKPFTFGTTRTPGIEGYSDIRVPVMHKDTEYTLLTSLLIASEATDSPKLKALSDIMSEYGIDVALFESAVKVGIQGVVDIDNIDSYEEVYNRLKDFVGNTDNPRIREVVHSVPYDYYGIQVETVEHHSDTKALLGTQIKKLILGNIIGSVDIKGKKYTKEDIYKEYNELLSQNMLEDYEELKSELLSIDSMSDIIKKEVLSRPGFSDEIIKASTVVEAPNPVTGVLEKQFFLPLHDPVQFDRIQYLLFGTIRNRVIKQKIKGGSLFQVSSFGFTDKLQIEYDTKGSGRIKYIPCYMPIWSEDLKELCWNEETKSYDITRIPNEIRYMIGYRIPTEGASSMLPLYVKGFIPDLNGSTIILPSDCYTLIGSDNDGDKIYFMAPEYKVKRYDTAAIIKDYNASEEAIQVLNNLLKGKIDESWIEDAPMDFKTYYEQVKHKYEYSSPIIKYLKYNSSIPISENTKAQRNNRIIDIIFSILTSPEGFQFIIRPQGFNTAKQVAEIIKLLSDVHTEKELMDKLGTDSFEKAVDKLVEMSYKEIVKLTNRIQTDPLSPMTQIEFHSQNSNGANMIGLYAVNNVFHAIAQYTDMACTPFTINGTIYSSLHDMRNKNNTYISNNLSTMVGASVDNTKFPVLGSLMQNPITGGIATLMLNTGVEILDIALFLNQSIVKTTVSRLQDAKNVNRETVIKNTIEPLKKYVSKEIDEKTATLRETMIREMVADKKNADLQFSYGNLFLKLYKISSDLFLQSAFLKADTQAGTIDSDIAGTYSKQSLMTALKIKTENGTSNIINPILPENMETIDMDNINKSKVPFIQASYSLAYEGVQQMLGKWLPQLGKNIYNIIFNENGFISYSIDGRLSDKDIRSIFNDMYVYLISNEPFFNSHTDSEGNVIIGRENREYYIKNFPVEFFKEIGKNPKLKNNGFISKFTMKKADTTIPVDRLVFSAASDVSYQREYYTKEWEALLLDPQTVNFAMELFKYMHFFGGFGYNFETYINNAPVLLRKIIPGYIEMLDNIKTYPFDDSFIHQWIANHRSNRRFVPEYNINDYKGNWIVKDNIIYMNSDSIPAELIMGIEDERLSLRPIIAVKFNNKDVEYYTVVNTIVDSGETVLYGLCDNLPGYKGRILEYDCNTFMPESVLSRKAEPVETSPEVPIETTNKKIVVHNIKKKKQLSDYNLEYKEDVNGEISC